MSYVEGSGPPPHWIRVSRYVDRFGALAVFGRQPSAGELRKMATVEALVAYYTEYSRAEDKGEWSKRNPMKSELVVRALLARAHGASAT